MSLFVEGHYSKLVSMSLHCKWLSPWTFLVVYICGITLIFGIVNPQYFQLFVQSYDNYHDHMCGIHHQSVLQLSSIITINLYTHIVTLNQLHCICGTFLRTLGALWFPRVLKSVQHLKNRLCTFEGCPKHACILYLQKC